jgi:hypothetical protein
MNPDQMATKRKAVTSIFSKGEDLSRKSGETVRI